MKNLSVVMAILIIMSITPLYAQGWEGPDHLNFVPHGIQAIFMDSTSRVVLNMNFPAAALKLLDAHWDIGREHTWGNSGWKEQEFINMYDSCEKVTIQYHLETKKIGQILVTWRGRRMSESFKKIQTKFHGAASAGADRGKNFVIFVSKEHRQSTLKEMNKKLEELDSLIIHELPRRFHSKGSL